MEQAQTLFTNVGLAHDVETARQLLQQHQDLKKSKFDAEQSKGNTLLEPFKESCGLKNFWNLTFECEWRINKNK